MKKGLGTRKKEKVHGASQIGLFSVQQLAGRCTRVSFPPNFCRPALCLMAIYRLLWTPAFRAIKRAFIHRFHGLSLLLVCISSMHCIMSVIFSSLFHLFFFFSTNEWSAYFLFSFLFSKWSDDSEPTIHLSVALCCRCLPSLKGTIICKARHTRHRLGMQLERDGCGPCMDIYYSS